MAATANAILQDEAVDHAIDMLRYERGVVQRMIAVLNRTDARLAAQLAEALMRFDAESFTVERLEELLLSVRTLNAEAYAAVEAALQPGMRGEAAAESTYQATSLRAAIPAPVQARFPVAAVSAEQVYAAALSRPFQGRLLSGWMANLAESRMSLVRNAVRQGFVEGQTASEIIRAIRGTRANNYADGLLERPRRELAAVVQTALSHTAQTARSQFTAANADLIKATRWVSTLDSRTSPMCRIRDGKTYTADAKHKPIGHTIPWLGGPGRLHFNCRSVSVPVLKSLRELGLDVDDMPPATRASMDGQVPAETTYAQWFARQSAERQDDIVGAERGKLYRAGKVSFDRFYGNKGRWLTLDQLMGRIRG